MKKLLLLIMTVVIVFKINAFVKVGNYAYDLNPLNHTAEVVEGSGEYSYFSEVTIPNEIRWDNIDYTITSIGENAFKDCIHIQNITLPNSIIEIKKSAFEGCLALSSVELPNSVINIDEGAFAECYNLRSVYIGNNVKKISGNSFINAPLEKILISDLAAWCEIDFVDGNPLIDCGHLFLNNKEITQLEIPSGITKIKDYAFAGCLLESLIIPASVTEIGKQAFDSSNQPQWNVNVTCNGFIPPKINEQSFGYEWVLSGFILTVPETAENNYIRNPYWSKCKAINKKTYNQYVFNNLEFKYIKGSGLAIVTGFSNNHTEDRVIIPEGLYIDDIKDGSEYYEVVGIEGFQYRHFSEIELPETLNFIGIHCFSYVDNLKTVVVPEGVNEIAYRAFMGSTSIEEIALPSTLITIGNESFENTIIDSITLPESVTEIGEKAFYLTKLKNIELPSFLTTINNSTFAACRDLESVNIPSSVEIIGSQAFYACEKLMDIEIPRSVKYIGNSAFEDCQALTRVKLYAADAKIQYCAFNRCSSISRLEINNIEDWCSLNFEYNNAPYYISNPLFYSKSLYLNDEEITDLIIPEGVESIGDGVFFYYVGLNTVNIPATVITIGRDAFQGCQGLGKVVIPQSVRQIGDLAFFYCKGMKSLSLNNDDVLYIKNSAWGDCYNLETVSSSCSNPPFSNNFSVFHNSTYEKAVLYVPENDKEEYSNTTPWSKFQNIKGMADEDIYEILPKGPITLIVGQQVSLSLININNSEELSGAEWSSSDPSIAEVDSNGLVKAISPGTAYIIATYAGKSTICTIIVEEDAGVEAILNNSQISVSVYTAGGILIMKDCKVEDLKTLNKGIYIIVSGNNKYKISI